MSGLSLGAVIAERERAKDDREALVREQAANEIRLRERAEESVSRLSRRLFHAQEQERARIARELHDDIGQRVALLAVGLARLSRSAPDEVQQAETARLERQVVEIGTDIQALSHELHSARLELLGIETAARAFCEEFASQQQVTIAFVGRNVPRQLPSDTSLCLFRVLQEALHNSAKHSGVAHVDVQLWTADGEVHLAVSDAGSGFDLQAARLDRGLGLVSMEERLKIVAGALSIETRPGQGTRLHARTPYRS